MQGGAGWRWHPSARRRSLDPAIDAVDEGRKRHPVAAAKRVAQRMQFARIDLRQRRQQRRGALLKFEGIAAEQRQRARDAALRSLRRLGQRGIVDRDAVRPAAAARDDVVGRERPQRQVCGSATGWSAAPAPARG